MEGGIWPTQKFRRGAPCVKAVCLRVLCAAVGIMLNASNVVELMVASDKLGMTSVTTQCCAIIDKCPLDRVLQIISDASDIGLNDLAVLESRVSSGQNPLHQSPRNKSVTSWRRQKSVLSFVSCRFPNSTTTTIFNLPACCQQVGNFPVYGEVTGKRV